MTQETKAKGKAGRPAGSKTIRTQMFGDALRVALLRIVEDPNDNFKKKQQMALVAESLIRSARNGEVAAIREIADRIDGKVPTNISAVDPDGNEVPTGIAVVFISSDKKE